MLHHCRGVNHETEKAEREGSDAKQGAHTFGSRSMPKYFFCPEQLPLPIEDKSQKECNRHGLFATDS